MGKLTAKEVEKITEPGKYDDGDGLRLVVSRSGGKRWVLRYQIHGRRREMGLGRLEDVGLKSARAEAGVQRKLLLAGLDPIEERKRAQRERAANLGETPRFRDVAAGYIESHRGGWKSAKHAQQWQNTLDQYVHPVIGDLMPSDVHTDHILRILQPIWLAKPETANRIRNRIELVLDAAKAKGLREGENPARWRGHLDKLLPKRSKVRAVKHHPALPWEQIPEFWQAIKDHTDLSARAVRLTLLTALRTSEVIGARWGEIDLKAREWIVPATRMKAKKPHRVPLSDAAAAELEALPLIDGSDCLFPGQRGAVHMSNMAMLQKVRGMDEISTAAGGKGWRDTDGGVITVHGFRSAFRDWAAECSNAPNHIAEMALAHTISNDVEKAYRRGDLFEKRKTLMADWAAYVTTAPDDNVDRMNP